MEENENEDFGLGNEKKERYYIDRIGKESRNRKNHDKWHREWKTISDDNPAGKVGDCFKFQNHRTIRIRI